MGITKKASIKSSTQIANKFKRAVSLVYGILCLFVGSIFCWYICVLSQLERNRNVFKFFAFLCTHINRVHDQHTIPSCCSEALFVCICFSSHTRKKMCCTTILWRMFWGKGNFMMKKGVAVAKYTIQLHRASSDNNIEKNSPHYLLFSVIVQEGNL